MIGFDMKMCQLSLSSLYEKNPNSLLLFFMVANIWSDLGNTYTLKYFPTIQIKCDWLCTKYIVCIMD